MATYSDKTFDTKVYDLARPSYPDGFYTTLIDYHTSKSPAETQVALDIGCGSGFVTFKLSKFFDSMIGTDISETMIKQCVEDPRTEGSNLKFAVAPAEKSPEFIAPNSVDLLTGAECCHWVDHPKFFAEAHRVLKPNGTLAYWFYLDPVFIGPQAEKANEIYQNYAYGSSVANGEPGVEKYMGLYYEQPGHEFFRTALKTVEIPKTLFGDIVINHYDPRVDGEDGSKTTLFIKKTINLEIWRQYVKSWSAYHTWMAEHGATNKDIADTYIDELKDKLGWTDSDDIQIIFPTIYFFSKKI